MRGLLLLLLIAPLQDDLESLKKKFKAEQSEAYTKRASTISRIGALKTEEAARFLVGVLDGETDRAVCGALVRAMGATRTEYAFTRLVALLDDESAEYASRSAAVYGIGAYKNDKAYAILAARLRDRDPKNRLRTVALYALRPFPLDMTRNLYYELLDETSYIYPAEAMRKLAPQKDPRVLEKARAMLANEKAVSTYKEAAVEPFKVTADAAAVTALTGTVPAPTGRLRKKILDVLVALKDRQAIDMLLATAVQSPNPSAREIALAAVGRMKHKKSFAILEKALTDPNEKIRVSAIESLGDLGDKRAGTKLLKLAGLGGSPTALAAIDALASLAAAHKSLRKKVIKKLKKLAVSSEIVVRLTAVSALGELRAIEALKIFKKLLLRRVWQERAAAIRALVSLCSKQSIDVLIDQLDKEEGRLKADVLMGLRALTGKTLGMDSEHWRDWWAVAREGFEMPEKPGAAGNAGNMGTGSYYGVPLLSDRITFCLDISGSMGAKVADTTRLEQAKGELIKAIEALKKGVRFNMIFFETRVNPWKTKLQELSPANVKEAVTRVKGLQPTGGTNIYDTLEKAMEDPDVDTIFLLSDGAPGAGKFTATEDILREIKKVNRTRQIVIHTISLGNSKFMKKLAEQNGGTYIQR